MDETLEVLIDRATDPAKVQDSSEYFIAVWDRVNKTSDGPQVATRYIAQKVRSVNERESLVALELIEACVKNCGVKFHQEIGKYKFLNELIKLLSTKYDGQWTALSVKNRIIELIYSWTNGLPRETKILDAYKMLKTQGVVTKDPGDPYLSSYPEESQVKPASVQDTIFEDEEKSKLLSRLLKSKHPEDLQAANRLIKSMVRQDEIKMEKVAKRDQDIETSCNNAKLLTEMLNHYHPSSPPQDKDLMKELNASCEKMRPALFRLASAATEDGDDGLGLAEILKANDELTRVIDEYRRKVGPSEPIAEKPPGTSSPPPGQPPAPVDPSASSLIDLGLHPEPSGDSGGTSSVLEDELKALGIHDTTVHSPVSTQTSNSVSSSWSGPVLPPPPYSPQPFNATPQATSTVGVVRPIGTLSQQPVAAPGSSLLGGPQMQQYPGAQFRNPLSAGMRMPQMGVPQRLGFAPRGNIPMAMGMAPMATNLSPMARGMAASSINRGPAPANKRGYESLKAPTTSLDILGQEFLQNQKQQQKQKLSVPPTQKAPDTQAIATEGTLLSLAIDNPQLATTSVSNGTTPPTPPAGVLAELVSLDNVFVPLDSVLPGDHSPVTILDKNGMRIIFHFAKTSTDLSRSDVIIVVISTMSTLKSAVKNFVYQAAVPKTMRVKLQPPSGTELPPHNPILPAAAITQVMLIARPSTETVRLKFKATYEVDGSTTVETGEVDSFPVS